MRLFLCEFITGGGLHAETLPQNLLREGEMMLAALLRDFLDAGITDLLVTRDERLPLTMTGIKSLAPGSDVWATWQKCMTQADAACLVAPETGGILHRLTLLAEQEACPVIGCSSEAVRITASKASTGKILADYHIPHIPVIDDITSLLARTAGWIVKPDDGVGAEECYFFLDITSLRQHVNNLISKRKYIVQEFVEGIPASLSLLCHQGQIRVLSCNHQLFEINEGRGHLKGVVVNGLRQFATEFERLALDIAQAFIGLSGYIGVDLIITDKGPVVVEINPRLTTAYAGLRRSLGLNPAELLLSLHRTGRLPEMHENDCSPVTIWLERT
jgi:tyramine---L-glutamate ligase